MHFRPAAAMVPAVFPDGSCLVGLLLATAPTVPAWAQSKPATKPEGEMRWALYVTLSHRRASSVHRHLCLRRLPRHRRAVQEQALVTEKKKREALLFQIQQLVHERVRFGPIWEYIWSSGVGPRVEEPVADAHQSVSLVGAARGSAPREKVERPRRA